MDIYAAIFSAALLAIGLLLILVFRPGRAGREGPPDDAARALRQQALKAERRLQRRRWRVWGKIDELHELFTQRAAAAEREVELLPPAPVSAESLSHARERGESDFAVPDIETAYEVFQREDFLKADTAQTSRNSAGHA